MKKQSGFTLIELMIVVAIVGILAALAVPAYQDYIVRSKMAEVMAQLAGAKTSVAEFTASQGALPTSLTEAGIPQNPNSDYVGAFQLDPTSGRIEAVLAGNLPGGLLNDLVYFTPTVDPNTLEITWDCGTNSDPATEYKFYPANCRST